MIITRQSYAVLGLGLASLLAVAGCNNLQAKGSEDAGIDSSTQTSGNFSSRALGNGSTETVADAQSSEAWVYFDLDTSTAVENPDAANRVWDLAFRRFASMTNGGDSGSGDAAGTRVVGEDYTALAQAPDGPWILDRTVPGQVDPRMAAVDSTLSSTDDNWYSYNPSTHVLSARSDIFYVLRTTAGNYFKIQMTGYYDAAGSPGFVKFNWAPVRAPNGMAADAGVDANIGDASDSDAAMDAASLDASPADAQSDAGESIPANAFSVETSAGTWTYLRANDHMTVAPSTPENSNEWDLAIGFVLFRSNSGTSGTGQGGVKVLGDGVPYNEVRTTTASDFVVDSLESSTYPGQSSETSQSAALINWWNYSGPPNHTVSPKPLVYIVRTANGTYAKLRLWSFAATSRTTATYTLSLEPIASN